MDMSSVFRTLFGREFGSGQVNYPESDRPALPTAMIGELKALDALRPGLGRAAIRFVETGTPTDLPDLIEAARKAAPRNPDYWQAEGARRDAEGACDLAMVTGAFPPGPELKRLLHVRVATGSVSRAYNASPTLENLLIDGFRFMVQGGLSRTKVKYSIAWDTVIPLKTLFAHLRQVGGTMADLFTLVLQQDDTKYLTPGSWALSADFADYAAVYPAALAEALRSIAPTFRAASVKLVEHHRATVAPEVEAVLVAMLTRPFDKQDREIATSALARLPAAQLLALLGRDLAKADIDTRYGLVQAAGRQATADVVALLKARLPVEKAAKVRAAIEAVIAVDTHDAATTAKGAVPGEAAGSYPATDGSTVTIPPRLGTGAGTPAPAFDDLRPDFDRLVATIEEKMRAEHPEKVERAVARGHTPPNPPKPFASDIIEESFAALTGGEPPLHERRHLAVAIRSHPQGQAWIRTVLARMSTADAVQSVGSTYGIVQSIFGNDRVWGADQRFGVDVLRGWIDEGRIDLRDLGAADELRRLLARLSYSYDRESVFAPLQALPREAVWPWMAEQISVLDEAMGLRPSEKPIALDRAMEALTLLPAVPQRYAAKLLDIAVSEKRPLRRQAMALLRDATDLASRLEGLLDDKRQQVRINVASWLADLRAVGSESALRRRLKKEKSDPVRAALIMSLQRLGADLSDVIGPAVLIAEAEAAAAKGTADLPDWLNAAALPAMYFRDGAPVPPALIRHWLALAIRLKDPAASGQFGIYLDQLRPEDARALSDRLLDAWIGFDTQAATLEEATAHAAATYQQHWSWLYQPNKSPALRDEIMAEIVREKTGEIINSGSDTKGVLALACRADPAFAAVRVRWFLKKHGRRSNQAMALLEVLAAIGQPATLQVVIAASVRLKQKSTQARAAEIAQRYAEDRGWSIDELADRTVPTAGFDDDGGLDLPCGTDGRPYAARIDAGLAIHLFNPDGKPIKTLPAGDDEMTKESKKALSTAKKELGQVVELQRGRLFEAMCTERNWASDDWRLAFLDHPVMRRLAERLVWQGLDAEGRPGGLFRPTQEGDLTDALDAAVDLAAHPRVRLAHGALVDEATCRAWTAHLADYEITPFIAQFDTLRAPLTAGQGEADAIVDRLGWAADSLTYRGVVEKRGYERVMGDGGGCNEYVKSFPSHGLTATIWHTGSNAVDENNRVALKELRFARRGSGGPLRLSEVPPVMLAECWADYHAAAAKGAFDPAWEAISPW